MSLRPSLPTRCILLGITLAVCVFSPPCASDTPSWAILYDSSDVTGVASPIPMGDAVFLDVTGIGTLLGIVVMPDANGFTIRAADGNDWRWDTGSAVLVNDQRTVPMTLPGIQQGNALFLDAETVSILSGVSVSVDAATKQIIFRRSSISQTDAPTELPDGWQSFSIAKPAATKATPAFATTDTADQQILPPSHDQINLGVGIGYVQGADMGMDITGYGKLSGGSLNMNAMVTRGNLGTRLRTAHVKWLDTEGGRGIEAGDMYSETWGLVQGARYSWKAGANHWPTISMNMNTSHTENPKASLSFIDALRISKSLNVQGEIGSDKARYVSVRYDNYPFQVFAFNRSLPDGYGKGEGVFGSVSLSRSVSLFYGLSESTDRLDKKSAYTNYGIRMPLFKRWGLSIGHNRTSHGDGSATTSSRSVGLTIPVTNKVHLYLRYQKNDWKSSTTSGSLLNIQDSSDNLLTSLSMFAGRRVHLDYQINRVSQNGQSVYQEQLVTNYNVSAKTSLQLISGFPNMADTDILRLRLQRELSESTALVIDYGRLSPFQSSRDIFGQRGFMVTVRRKFPVMVPALGGTVQGVVLDQLGAPIQNIAVQMGRFKAVSDKQGRYLFAHTPSGDYTLSIAEDSIPADYKVDSSSQNVKVERGSVQKIDFRLVPLGAVLGTVYADKNGNGRLDADEGVPDVAVSLDEHVTATLSDGRFAFYNLEPGIHTVKILTETLDKQFELAEYTQQVDLQPRGSITDMIFRLDMRRKPIVFTPVE